MFYYSWPRTEATGVYKGGKVTGTAWVDHEYALGGDSNQDPLALSYGWNWFSLLTSGPNKMEICVTQVRT
jgi:predicted secreted hydrolase